MILQGGVFAGVVSREANWLVNGIFIPVAKGGIGAVCVLELAIGGIVVGNPYPYLSKLRINRD